jgi:ABC-type nickel/cobalt efflux system permease component RcnA
VSPVGVLVACALAILAFAGPAPANPFGGPSPGGSPFEGRSPGEGSDRPVRRPPPMGAEGGLALPGPFNAAVGHINQVQRRLNQTVSRQMRAIAETGSPVALLTVTAVAFAYGVLHAAGPGHGKMVVSSFFLARRARPGRGILIGGLISLLQVLSSIAIVAVLALALDLGGFDIVNRSTWVELVSYGLIVLLGLYMVVEVATGRHGHHDEHGHRHGDRAGTGLIIAAGLTPCASAIILMLFALANGVFLVGVGAALVMAVGMGITVSVAGLAAIAARSAVVGSLRSRPRAAAWIGRALAVTGASLLTVVGSLFFMSAWTRLG